MAKVCSWQMESVGIIAVRGRKGRTEDGKGDRFRLGKKEKKRKKCLTFYAVKPKRLLQCSRGDLIPSAYFQRSINLLRHF